MSWARWRSGLLYDALTVGDWPDGPIEESVWAPIKDSPVVARDIYVVRAHRDTKHVRIWVPFRGHAGKFPLTPGTHHLNVDRDGDRITVTEFMSVAHQVPEPTIRLYRLNPAKTWGGISERIPIKPELFREMIETLLTREQ